MPAGVSLLHTGNSCRHRLINVVLPCHFIDASVFQSSPRLCDGHCYGWFRRWWSGSSSSYTVITLALWCACDTAYSWGVELGSLCSYLLRGSKPPGVPTDPSFSGTRQKGNVYFTGTYDHVHPSPLVCLGLQLLAAFMQAAGNIIPLYYLTTYSVYVLGFSPSTASMLLAANNAVNSVSRVSMGLLGDYVGRQNTMIICVRQIFSPIRLVAPLFLTLVSLPMCRFYSLVSRRSRSGFMPRVRVSSLSLCSMAWPLEATAPCCPLL